MAVYKHHFCMADEVISFIEKYYNAPKNFEKLRQNAKGEEEYAMIDRLLMMMKEVGEAFKEKFQEDEYLFQFLQEEDDLTLSSLLCYAYCDYKEETLDKQLASMRKNAKENPKAFLDVLLSANSETKEQISPDEELLNEIDHIPYTDAVKWNVWKIHTNVEKYVEHLCEIIQELYPLFEYNKDIYAYYGKRYEEEIATLYEGKDLYSYLCTKFDFHIEAEGEYIYPSVGKILSISFIDCKPKDIIIRYGVGMVNKLIEIQQISKEELFFGLKVLGDTSKFEILQLLGKETSYGAQLAEKLHLSTPTICYHMQALINARFVIFEKKQNRLYYRMNKEYLQYFLKQVEERLGV